jgi:diguanylate cyclase (GGDEF)-like protein
MSPSVPTPSNEVSTPASRKDSPRARSLTEALRAALADLGAAAVGVTRASGGAPKYFTRTAQAAQFFEDVCANGLQVLAQAATKGNVFGTNRVRSDSSGPVRGKLIAVSLYSPQGSQLGILVAIRLIDDAKFGAVESTKLQTMAREFEAILVAERAALTVPSHTATLAPLRSMWPTEPEQPVQTPSPAPDAMAAETPPAVATTPPPDPVAAAPDAQLPTAAPVPVPTAESHTDTREKAVSEHTVAEVLESVVVTNPVVPVAVPEAAAPVVTTPPTHSRPEAEAKVASLVSWTEFERRIRATESDDRLPGCVLYGDMDQLHVLNKLAGFAIGDRAISEVGSALQAADLPQGSCSCHISGDRYTVYIPRTTLAQGRRIAEQLSKSISGLSVPVHGIPTPISISFGVALIPASDGGLGHALAAAEAACKAAKDRGRGRVEVYQDADQSIVRRNDDVLVADRLRQALEAGRIEVFAQPIVRLNGSQSTSHYELLVRLIGDAGTHLSPTWFMSAATRYRMLVELDRAVVGHVLAKLEAQKALLARRHLRFSVNLSGPSIGDPDFVEWLVSRIGGVGVPGEWLQFEITETAAVANIAQTQAMIRRLQARGVQFALDDFGTGVSSFAYLKYFDVKMLKLDGSFVRDLMSNSRSESLVRGIAQLGRGMNIETVAECVETREVRDRLTQLGIDCAQGFLFGRPKPVDGVLATELGLPPPLPAPALGSTLIDPTATDVLLPSS